MRLGTEDFGHDDPTTATLLNNLALLYKAQGRYAETEPLYKRSLAIKEKALSPEHPDVAQSLNNLAALYKDPAAMVSVQAIPQQTTFTRILADR